MEKKSPAEYIAEGRALFDQGRYGKAVFALLKASGKENGEGDYWLGRCYLAMDEEDGKAPSKGAKRYLQFAADDGHKEAARLLAEVYGMEEYRAQAGEPEPPRPAPAQPAVPAPSEPASSPQPAPVPDDPDTLFQQGVAAYRAEDFETALALFEQLAQRDHVEAQYNTGVLYYHGHGTAADPEKALYWFQRAAGWGHRESQYNCGVLYKAGRVPPPTWPPPAPGSKKPPPRATRGPSRPWPLWTPPRPRAECAARR